MIGGFSYSWRTAILFIVIIFSFQMEWEEFLFDVDRKLAEADSRRNSGVSVGDRFSLSSTLIDLDTEQSLSTQELCDGSRKVLLVLLRHFA